MIKKNNSFVSLALGIFYCNRHNIPTESHEVGERTPKSHWNISLESTGYFSKDSGYSVVLEGSAGNNPNSDPRGSGILSLASSWHSPESNQLEKEGESCNSPKKSALILPDWWQSSIFVTTTETTR